MYKWLILASFLSLIFIGCPVEETPIALTSSRSQPMQVRTIAWMPGDTLIAAIAHSASSSDVAFRLYDLQGKVRSEIPLSANYFGSLFISKDGSSAIYNTGSALYNIDITGKTCTLLPISARIISASPETDTYALYDYQGVTATGDDRIVIANVHKGALDLLQSFPAYGFDGEFPLLLTAGRLATLEFDRSGSQVLVIRDADTNVLEQFFLSSSIRLSNIAVPSRGADFFYLNASTRAGGNDLLKFRTDLGVIDFIREIDGSLYAVTGNAEYAICKSNGNWVMVDVATGTEKIITAAAEGVQENVATSNNDKMVAIHAIAGDKITVLKLP